jgi:hypothetical protein
MRDLSRDSTHLYVKDKVQTFVDNLILESVTDVTRRWYSPQRHSEAPVLRKDRSWEVLPYIQCANFTVIRDPEDGLFKCWYEAMVGEPDPKLMALGMESRLLYAVSEDGLHWRKPELDVVIVDGEKTNILMGDSRYGGVHAMTVLLDPHPGRENERFKGIFTRMWDANRQRQIACAHSPDGLHWQVYEEPPVIGMGGARLCDVHLLFYDEDARQYVVNTRHFLMTAGATRISFNRDETFSRPYEPDNFASYSQRRIWQMRSSDFIHWSEPVLVAAADEEEDNLDESFYGLVQYNLGTLHLAPVCVFSAVDNTMEVQLLHGRDGLRWKRAMKRRAFLAPRGEGHWDAYMVSIVNPPIEVGDELRFYYGGSSFHHDWWLVGKREGIDHPETLDPLGCGAEFALGLASLRKDGYAGLQANKYRQGIIVTRPLISLGSKLSINARCAPGGSIRVEVLNRFGEVLDECTKDNCDPFTGDSTDHTVTWKGDPVIPAGRGQMLYWRKLKIHLRDAELFSFRFFDPVDDTEQYKTEKEW